MIYRLVNRYTIILAAMLFMHIMTVTVNGVLSAFDFIFVIFILTLDGADEENFIWLSLLFGFFTDFARDGFYGPGVAVFLLFYLIRFRTDVIMDMTKLHYRVLLFSSMSFIFCLYNLLITKYPLESAVYLSFVRTLFNMLVIIVLMSFFKGIVRAVKNT